MAEVTLGDFSFDPVAPSDFRLSLEGASKTGKSNTLAVFLEDLAETTMPTLVIERLGILSTVRQVDDSVVVVGGRDEPGVDLAVPLDSVEIVAEMVLDRGLKVILDVSTYETDDPDDHPEHRATSRVVKALNDRALARLRSGDRRKCLLVVDEVHVLAPENNAPHINLDDDVRRARAQLVKVATEGGNKGINFVAAYQRRAYASKGVVSQMDNFVIHRLHKTDRKDAAREVGVSEEEIAELGVGEAFIYGDITNQRVTGPVQVRRRTSPDPREETFELPEPPDDLREQLDSLAEEVGEVQAEREARQDRIEELEAEVERLREAKEELEKQVDVERRMADAFERIAAGDDVGDGVPEGFLEDVENLQDRNAELEQEVDDLEDQIGYLDDQLSTREDEVEELETELAEAREVEIVRDEVVSAARTILRQFGALDLDAEEAREEVDRLIDEKRDLEAELDAVRSNEPDLRSSEPEGEFDDVETYAEFLDRDLIRDRINTAKQDSNVIGKAVTGIIRAVVEKGGPVSYKDVADRLGYSGTSHVSSAATALEAQDVVVKDKRGGDTYVDLALDDFERIAHHHARQRRAEEVTRDI